MKEDHETLLYNAYPHYYDLLYSKKEYEKEAEKTKELIETYKTSEGRELLDVACGTGNHLKFLQEDFDCTGLDLNKPLLKVARKKLEHVRLVQGNMINFDLSTTFDVILCLFSSIGYVRTYENLKKTINTFVQHLKPGGVTIIEPWLDKKHFQDDTAHMTTYNGEEIKIARVSYSQRQGNRSHITMHYLVGENGRDVQYFQDVHTMGLFERDKTLHIMEENGLDAEFIDDERALSERGLFIGAK